MSPLERTLYDLKARAEADPFYVNISLFVLRPRYTAAGAVADTASFASIQTSINNALQCLVKKGGKGGAAVTFLMPMGDTDKPNISGPQMKFIYTARVQEHPIINWGPEGVRLSAEEIALHTLQLFHLSSLNGANSLAADASTLTAGEKDGFITYDVRLFQQGNLPAPAKVALPIISPSSGAVPQSVAITCGTAGAAIYYTLDGSYPSSANPAAELYSAPIAVAAAATLRAAAEKSGQQQSNVAQAYFT